MLVDRVGMRMLIEVVGRVMKPGVVGRVMTDCTGADGVEVGLEVGTLTGEDVVGRVMTLGVTGRVMTLGVTGSVMTEGSATGGIDEEGAVVLVAGALVDEVGGTVGTETEVELGTGFCDWPPPRLMNSSRSLMKPLEKSVGKARAVL